MARAAAHQKQLSDKFSDPTALALLSDGDRAVVERMASGQKPSGFREGLSMAFLARRAHMMVGRTIAIDEAIREAATSQLVTLGAGLDGRAFRLAELRDTTVFEIDHPDSQRDKRARAAKLTASARAVHFVPVDFERDDLAQSLESSGHDSKLATTWVWEGVVMYLTLQQIESTLAVVQRRSAPGSRLIIAYFVPARILWLVGPFVRLLGEPVRCLLEPEQMKQLLAKYGFRVQSDESLPAATERLAPELAPATQRLKHMHIVVADRAFARGDAKT
jgi:methyltransferase (TIGR00027 family)